MSGEVIFYKNNKIKKISKLYKHCHYN